MLSVLHVITGLGCGGAEAMLARLCERLRDRVRQSVVSMTGGGMVGPQIEALGLCLSSLNMRPGRPDPRAVAGLSRLIRTQRPDLVHAWMYHANLLAGVAARMAGSTPVVWAVHHSSLDPARNKRLTVWTARLSGWLAGPLARRVVFCSRYSAHAHCARGYPESSMEVIPNGFDLVRFRPDPEARRSLRAEFGLEESAFLVGLAARFDPLKDHRTFLRAAGRLSPLFPHMRFLLCGDGVTKENAALAHWVSESGAGGAIHLAGRREDMERVLAGLDVLVSSSLSEAFPNVIGEAMACGVPCVVTAAGDSGLITGPAGKVVAVGDWEAIAEAVAGLAKLGPGARRKLGRLARDRIRQEFSIESVADRYLDLYCRVSGRRE